MSESQWTDQEEKESTGSQSWERGERKAEQGRKTPEIIGKVIRKDGS